LKEGIFLTKKFAFWDGAVIGAALVCLAQPVNFLPFTDDIGWRIVVVPFSKVLNL